MERFVYLERLSHLEGGDGKPVGKASPAVMQAQLCDACCWIEVNAEAAEAVWIGRFAGTSTKVFAKWVG